MTLASLDVAERDAILTARIAGEIDISNASALREELSMRTPNHALGLILDLSEVDYLDSAGIQLIHRLRESLQARGQRLRLVIPDASVINHTLRLAGVGWERDIFLTDAAARQALAG